ISAWPTASVSWKTPSTMAITPGRGSASTSFARSSRLTGGRRRTPRTRSFARALAARLGPAKTTTGSGRSARPRMVPQARSDAEDRFAEELEARHDHAHDLELFLGRGQRDAVRARHPRRREAREQELLAALDRRRAARTVRRLREAHLAPLRRA